MSMDAAHWLLGAEEARMMARLCDDPVLRSLMEEVAQNYGALAASRHPDAGASARNRGESAGAASLTLPIRALRAINSSTSV
jgi:hypothetical protein